MIQLLIKNQAKVDVNNKEGDTALIVACREKADPKVIKFLVSQGANTAVVNQQGDTAMVWALKQNLPTDTIQLLVNSGALGRLGDWKMETEKNEDRLKFFDSLGIKSPKKLILDPKTQRAQTQIKL